ncbi:MAG TPA: WD40 repeat domain-containing protein, partial [Gemmataceae bacterium]|nr:WD40 repeat domain-containing protein [Gemmataceae bacterium]
EFTDEKAAPPAVINRNNIGHHFVGTFDAATISPDGKLVAGASRTKERVKPDRLEVWALAPGNLIRANPPRLTIDTPDGFVWLGFTPDSKRLVGVTRGQEPDRPGVGVPGQPVQVVPGARAETGTAYVWDAATGKELRTFTVPGGLKRNYAISPDGDTLYAAGDKGRVAAIDLTTGKERFAVDAVEVPKDKPWNYVVELAIAPDGRTLIAVENHAALVSLDAATGKRLWRSTDYEAKQVYAVVGWPDGKRFAIGGVDGGVVFGDVATGKITPMPGYRSWFDAAAIDGAGRTAVTAGRDGNVRRWDVATGSGLGKVALADFNGFSALAFSPDGKQVVGMGSRAEAKGEIVVADVTTGRTVARPKGDVQHAMSAKIYGAQPAAWHPDGSLILTDADAAVRFGPEGKKLQTYTSKEIKEGSDAYSVAVSLDGKRVALAGRGPRGTHPVPGWVAVFDAATGGLIRAAQTQRELIGVAFAPDGSVVVSGGVYPPDRRFGPPPPAESTAAAVALFDPASGKFHHPFTDPTDGTRFRGATLLTVSPTGYQVAVTEQDSSITVYERASGAVRRRLRGHRNTIYQLAFTPDGSRLVSVSWDGTGLVWDVAPPRPATPPATDAERLKRWESLLEADGTAAHKIMGELAADPAGLVALLKANLKPATATDGEIDKLTGPRLRERRGVELLEVAGTADARALLEELARPGGSPLAHDAAAAVRRLRTR